MRSRRVRRLALSRFVHRPDDLPPEEAARLAAAYAFSQPFLEASREMRSRFITDLELVRVPVTLAWAEFDRLVRRPSEGRVPEEVRQVSLPGCGHVPTWDDPGRVARVVLEGSARD
jgi:pimeloyl-ACP methyl ester carboxylesterase